MAQAAHIEVARRFQRFLEEVGLTRDGFAAAVDGAISPHSLFSVLNGHRRPSRALAVLIERSWGFRADFLLEGKGEMWTQPAYASATVGGAVLSPMEAAVVGFMRGSVAQSRAMDEQLEIAETWARHAARLEQLADAVVACGTSESAAESCAHPLLMRLLVEQLRFVADQHAQLVVSLQRLRAHDLLDPILDRCLRALPAHSASDDQRERIAALQGPLLARREEIRLALEEAVSRSRSGFAALDSPDALVDLARVRAERVRERRLRVARLADLAAGDHADEARQLAIELDATDDEAALSLGWLERVIRDLSRDAEATRVPSVESPTRESLRGRFDELLEALAA